MMTRVSNGWGKVLPPGRNELNRSHDTTKLIFYLPHGGGGALAKCEHPILHYKNNR